VRPPTNPAFASMAELITTERRSDAVDSTSEDISCRRHLFCTAAMTVAVVRPGTSGFEAQLGEAVLQ
jgi:hypothetical protein